MGTVFELALQTSLSKDKINITDCKECKHFLIQENKLPACTFEGTNPEECVLYINYLSINP